MWEKVLCIVAISLILIGLLCPTPDITIADRADVNYMYGVATAYHPWSGGINTDGYPDITATGEKAEEGVIAVDPEVIPYGSEVMIISGKTVIRGQAQDTGGFRFENPKQVDILMECAEEAREWGVRESHIIWW